MRKFSTEGEQLAPVVFGVKPDESQVMNPPGMASTPEPEPITVVKERLQKALERMRSATTDEELVGLISESHNSTKRLKEELANLKAAREFLDPELYKLAEGNLVEQISLATAAIQAAVRRQPNVMSKIGEINRRAHFATEFVGELPKDPAANLAVSQKAFTTALERAVEERIFFNPSSNSEIHGRLPLPFLGKFYAPASNQDEVIHLFDTLCSFKKAVEETRTQRWEERDEAAAGYVASEDEVKAGAFQTGEGIVSFFDLLSKPGVGRLALVALAFSEGQKPVGKAAITRRGGSKFFAIKATTTTAAEILFRIPCRNEKGEVSLKWLPERELQISFKNGRPDFSGIYFDPIRNSLEFAYNGAIRRKDSFERELAAQRKTMETGSGNLEDLPAGKPGVYPVHIFDWRTGQGEKTTPLVFAISSDGESLMVMSTTPGTLRAAPWLTDYFNKSVSKDDFFKDKRMWAIYARAVEVEISRRVNTLLKSNPEMGNLRKDHKAFTAFVEKQPGDYFFSFFWREGQGKQATNRGVYAHLQVAEESMVQVVATIGKFSENFFRDLVTSPKPVDQIHGRVRGALRSMARNHFGLEGIPAFLLDTKTSPEPEAESASGTPISNPIEEPSAEATTSASAD